jgi:hypothetical protein
MVSVVYLLFLPLKIAFRYQNAGFPLSKNSLRMVQYMAFSQQFCSSVSYAFVLKLKKVIHRSNYMKKESHNTETYL